MTSMTAFSTHGRRAVRTLAAIAAAGVLGACDNVLAVENPGAIDDRDLRSTPLLAPQMVNAVISDFQRMFGDIAYAGAIFTDEAVTGHNFTQWEEIDLRIVREDNTVLHSDIYVPLQRARAAGEDMAQRLRGISEAPEADLRVATALAYGGYAYVLLGEMFCYAPVVPTEAERSSDELLRMAVHRFQEAIAIATAARAAGAPAAEADRILNLARVGAARASLQLGENARAVEFATPVPAGFTFWVRHGSAPTYLRNAFWGHTTGTNHNLGVGENFRGLNDPRVRHAANPATGHNQKTQLWRPFQPSSFSEWSPTGAGVAFREDTGIRLASGLEARYILAEAGALGDAQLRAFLDERRAVGNQGAFAGGDLRAELREQRRRDFFLSGHRLGDLRRYQAQHGIDAFPTGAHPNDALWGWGSYGDATCFVPSRAERIGNPSYRP
jgi:starch-binding outer membrane protein, SusD/RagB family